VHGTPGGLLSRLGGVVNRVSWIFRMAVVIGAGALLVSATTAAVAPRVWRIANAHEQQPIELPEFQPLAQRTYVYDTAGNEIAIFELENSQPVSLDQVPRTSSRRSWRWKTTRSGHITA
jgi:hypothetical protein